MTPREHSSAPIAWCNWSAETFARAADTGRPVLLALGTAWSEACAHLDETGYRDPEVVRIVTQRFVAIRVDADERPDIGDRYGLGGWPATLCLTPEGEVLDGAVRLDAVGIAALLRRAADALEQRADAIAAETRAAIVRRARARDAGQDLERADDLTPIAWLERRLVETFDPQHGGFSAGPKMPYFRAIDLALRRYLETGSAELGRIVTRTLDAIARTLHDPIAGGLHRCAESADWTQPHSEKLLEDNADGLLVYLDAWQVFGDAGYRTVADAVRRYVMETLWSSTQHGFRNSQRADAQYYSLDSAPARQAVPAPPVDSHVYAPSNARMVSALLHLAGVTGDRDAAERAQEALEQQLLRGYEPGRGVAHSVESGPTVRGLLVDQVRVAAATLDAHDSTGDEVYRDIAQELMLFVLRTLRDHRTGGLLDRTPGAEEVGLLREPFVSVELTGEAATVLLRLAQLAPGEEFAERAREVLDACRSRYRSSDLMAASYVRAATEAAAEGR